MNLIACFEAYARDFEQTFVDDDWSRLEPYFTEDAVYVTLDPPVRRQNGREAVLTALRRAVSSFDRRCTSRVLETTHGPAQASNQVRREWACTFTCAGAPPLRISGLERAVYDKDRISFLEEQLTAESRQLFDQWLHAHGAKLASK
ncbi:MAG: nuclear transport factor 2 family protein [Deltaproteobacteria bacterium]|nr:nuclear transport factor 2 family protein [Deltaproteobacteria bacterium]MBI3389061.1 nuclear transport factor 2 family protein [Deltaproteobacteria bacterium]